MVVGFETVLFMLFVFIYVYKTISQIGGFLYFGDHFGFKMATIANQHDRHMV
jgi:hypothetical protein